MKIGAISNVNTFKGTQEASTATSPNEKKDIKEVVKDNKGKIALGLGALAAVGIAAVAISRGKKVPSELSIDDFKKIGKFNKGVATVKGKPFNGMINVVNKEKGRKYVLEYTDGVLKSSTYYDNIYVWPNKLSKKTYSIKDGAHVIEEEVFKQTLQKEPGITRRIINGDRIIKEAKGADERITRDILVKQKNGEFRPKYKELEWEIDGKTHLWRMDLETGVETEIAM